MRRFASFAAVLGIALVAACRDELPTVPRSPSFEISDGAHSGGNLHFFFLPPLVSDRDSNGTFDANADPLVSICEWQASTGCQGAPIAEFTRTGRSQDPIGIEEEDVTFGQVRVHRRFYVVKWQTDDFNLSTSKTYRIRVLVAGTELGHADVDLVADRRELRNVDTDQFVGLIDGKTLRIRFRIEQGAVTVVGSQGGTVRSEDGNVTIDVPPGALGGNVGFTVQPAAVTPTQLADAGLAPGAVYEFGPSGAVFPTPINVTIHYDPAALGDKPEDQLVLLTQVNGLWARIPGSSVNPTDHTITAAVEHFSLIGVGYGDPTTIRPRSLSIVLGRPDVGLDATTSFTARLRYWKSLTPTVATIDASTGLVHGVAVGQARIQVFVDDPTYQTATYSDEVYVSVLAVAPGDNQYAWFTQRSGWTGAHLYAIYGVSSTDFFIVGRGGTILRSDGVTATTMVSGTTRTLLGVWARSASDAYVVGLGAPGTGSSVLWFNGSSWATIFTDPTVTVYGVHGNSRVTLVAAGDRVLRFDAARNLLPPYTGFPAGTTIRAIAAEEDNSVVIAVGDVAGTGMVFRSTDDGASFDAGQVPLSEIGPPASGPLTSVWRDPTNGFVAAASLDGRVVESGDDGGFWAVNRRATGNVFHALTSRPRGVGANLPQPEVFLGGDNGKLWWNYRCRCPIENTGFTSTEAFNQDINGLWTAPDGTVWGVGMAGFVFHQNAAPAHDFTVKSTGQPFADAWAFGDGHVVVASATFKSEAFTTTSFGTAWRGMPLDVNGVGFQGAFGSTSGADVYLVGFNGAIAHGTSSASGYTFTMQTSGTTEELDDVWVGIYGRTAYAVGAGGTVLRTGDWGATWVPRGSPLFATKQMLQVYGLSDNDVFVAADDGSIYRTQDGGLTWVLFRAGAGELPTGLLVVSPTELYMGVAQGGAGRIVRLVNGTWYTTTIPGTRFMSGAWSPGGGGIFVAGSNGTVVVSTDKGATWTAQATGTTRDLYAITGASNGGASIVLFATGAAGTIVTGVRP